MTDITLAAYTTTAENRTTSDSLGHANMTAHHLPRCCVPSLSQLYRISPASRTWLLGYVVHDPYFTQQIMFFCPHAVVRDAFCELLSLVVDEQCRTESHRHSGRQQHQQQQRDSGSSSTLGAEVSHERTQRRLSFPIDAPTNGKRDRPSTPPAALRSTAPSAQHNTTQPHHTHLRRAPFSHCN